MECKPLKLLHQRNRTAMGMNKALVVMIITAMINMRTTMTANLGEIQHLAKPAVML